MKQEINYVKTAPAAAGACSQAVRAAGLLFVSGQLPVNILAGFIPAEVRDQTRQALENIKAILTEEGLDVARVVKTTVFLQDLNDFADMNDAYSEFFGEHAPARSCLEAARLPKDVRVKIEAIAVC